MRISRYLNRMAAGRLLLLCLWSTAVSSVLAGTATNAALTQYRQQLDQFRKEFGGSRPMPAVPFFLFGMGNRTKLVYSNGKLREAISGRSLRQWEIADEVIIPPNYQVELQLKTGERVSIAEDEKAVWIEENGRRTLLHGTDTKVVLPSFSEFKYDQVLRVLHQEILINILNGKPLPNFLVYSTPWRRDAAMMAMCLRKTDNLELIRNWVLSLEDPYDHNNKVDGVPENEADNLGETLYLVSLFSNRRRPIVRRVLEDISRVYVNDGQRKYIRGRSDFHEAPGYETKWLKFGLRSMGMDDPYSVPRLRDDYSSLFWWDFKEMDVEDAPRSNDYPYLSWARDHYFGLKRGPISNQDYPLTWESNASQASYEWMAAIDPQFVRHRTAVPHSWHAAEVFLYAYELKK
ncbi:MAG TPA: hypothetical protein VL793_12965 [Patescibacteria group bacterium]|nr:hypothetical protein [Patescibacteria group bacterium]